MNELWNSFTKAIELIVSLDAEVIEIAGRSLRISLTSTALASLMCLPLASVIHFKRFPGKRLLIGIIQTFYSVPTVVIGLLVFSLFSRVGPLGGLDILWTPTAMVIGQMVLVTATRSGST